MQCLTGVASWTGIRPCRAAVASRNGLCCTYAAGRHPETSLASCARCKHKPFATMVLYWQLIWFTWLLIRFLTLDYCIKSSNHILYYVLYCNSTVLYDYILIYAGMFDPSVDTLYFPIVRLCHEPEARVILLYNIYIYMPISFSHSLVSSSQMFPIIHPTSSWIVSGRKCHDYFGRGGRGDSSPGLRAPSGSWWQAAMRATAKKSSRR